MTWTKTLFWHYQRLRNEKKPCFLLQGTCRNVEKSPMFAASEWMVSEHQLVSGVREKEWVTDSLDGCPGEWVGGRQDVYCLQTCGMAGISLQDEKIVRRQLKLIGTMTPWGEGCPCHRVDQVTHLACQLQDFIDERWVIILGSVVKGKRLVGSPREVARRSPIRQPHVVPILHEEFNYVHRDGVQREDTTADTCAMK